MSAVAARDLRNHTRDVLDRVAAGEHITITIHGRPVADLVPSRTHKPVTRTRDELLAFLSRQKPDPELRALLDELSSETTDDLDDPWTS